MKSFSGHLPFGTRDAYVRETMAADLDKLANLVRVCGFLMLAGARSSSIVVDREVFNGEGRGGRSFLRGRFTSKNRVFSRVAELRRTVNVNLIRVCGFLMQTKIYLFWARDRSPR